jgi:FdhD protein
MTDTINAAGQQCVQVRVTDPFGEMRDDAVAIEEPLEIRLGWSGNIQTATVTMRTPGHDRELAAGFLLAEKVNDDVRQISGVRPCGGSGNALRVELRDGCTPRLQAVTRNFAAPSSCGLCGRTTFDDIDALDLPAGVEAAPQVDIAVLSDLPSRLRRSQVSFLATGGLHAVASFTQEGKLLRLFEDIGRHNAFDKLIGATALAGEHLRDSIVLLSGRAGYEMVQKAAVAGVGVLAAIGAPSSLAVRLAQNASITLIGFLREDRFNIYSHAVRVLPVIIPQSQGAVA